MKTIYVVLRNGKAINAYSTQGEAFKLRRNLRRRLKGDIIQVHAVCYFE